MRNFFSIEKETSIRTAWILFAAVLAALAGCGGGSPASSAPPTDVTPPATAASVQLLVSSPQMPSSGVNDIDLTAVVLDATRQGLAGRTVAFSSNADPTAFINSISAAGISDSNGIVTAKLNLGSNKTNRTIAITATVDGVKSTNAVDVTGTAITVSGSTSLSFGATTTLVFVVKDSAGTPLPAVPVTLASQNGNTIVPTPASGVTDSAGQITAAVTATQTGNDVITASAAGASKAQALTVAGDSFGFASPAALSTIPLNTAQSVSIFWSSAGTPVSGTPVTFSATRGTISGSPVTTDATGAASVSISSTSAGAAIISASGPGGSPAAVLNVVFVATSAANVTAQASPGVVQVTSGSGSQTNNTSTISVTVRDAVGNLVQNARINFNIFADPSGGLLSAASATTDGSGSAAVTYTAGATTSPQNGVVISATVVDIGGKPVSPPVPPANATLTVGGTALFVRLGTDNQVSVSANNSVAYSKEYLAIVTDSAGNAVPAGTEVRFSLRPSRFAKGNWVPGATTWVQVVNVSCVNEDVNFNGIADPGEDKNGNGRLDPGNVASVTGTAVTNAEGIATATLTYPKDYAYWAEVVLEGRAGGVVGNDPPSTATFFLPGRASDYSNLTVAPPGVVSPFGLGDPASSDNVCGSAF